MNNKMADLIGFGLAFCVLYTYIFMLGVLWCAIRSDKIALKFYERVACKETCMCGSSLEIHGWWSDHIPVSQYDHVVSQLKPYLRG